MTAWLKLSPPTAGVWMECISARTNPKMLAPAVNRSRVCCCKPPSDLDLDLSQSVMIGDAVTDLQAGQAAGVGQTYLLLTGRGAAQVTVGQPDILEALCARQSPG
jgi:histidinol phosphatase-like enzyme